LLAIALEAYFEWIIAGYLNYDAQIFSFDGERVGVILGYVSLFISVLLIPAVLLYIFTKDISDYKTDNFRNKWGVVFEDIKTSDKFLASYFIIYCARRMIFCLFVFFVSHLPNMQLLMIQYMNLFVYLYVGNSPL